MKPGDLRVRTYAVVPLLPDLGVLEWVRDTSGGSDSQTKTFFFVRTETIA